MTTITVRSDDAESLRALCEAMEAAADSASSDRLLGPCVDILAYKLFHAEPITGQIMALEASGLPHHAIRKAVEHVLGVLVTQSPVETGSMGILQGLFSAVCQHLVTGHDATDLTSVGGFCTEELRLLADAVKPLGIQVLVDEPASYIPTGVSLLKTTDQYDEADDGSIVRIGQSH